MQIAAHYAVGFAPELRAIAADAAHVLGLGRMSRKLRSGRCASHPGSKLGCRRRTRRYLCRIDAVVLCQTAKKRAMITGVSRCHAIAHGRRDRTPVVSPQAARQRYRPLPARTGVAHGGVFPAAARPP